MDAVMTPTPREMRQAIDRLEIEYAALLSEDLDDNPTPERLAEYRANTKRMRAIAAEIDDLHAAIRTYQPPDLTVLEASRLRGMLFRNGATIYFMRPDSEYAALVSAGYLGAETIGAQTTLTLTDKAKALARYPWED